MKKSIFILAALFAATLSNAQITYERTIVDGLTLGSGVEIIGLDMYQLNTNAPIAYFYLVGEYLLEAKETDETHATYNILDANTLSVVKSFNLTQGDELGILISRGIFTTDGKWAWVLMHPENSEIAIVTENGSTIAKLPWEYDGSRSHNVIPFLLKTKTTYKLVVPRQIKTEWGSEDSFDIYSVPGNVESSQDIIAPVAPRNSRKVLKKDQVLIENADKTYTLQGQEIK